MAETTRLLFNGLLRKYPTGYSLHQLALWHLHAVTTPNWPLYPTKSTAGSEGQRILAKADRNGEQSLTPLVQRIRPDIVFAFNDPQNLQFLCHPPQERSYKLVLYVNFDGYPAPPDYASLFHADRIYTMSAFARSALMDAHPKEDGRVITPMYSPADTARFHPISASEKNALRGRIFPAGLDRKAFVIGWIGNNQWRKQAWIVYPVIHLLRTGRYLLCRDCGRAILLETELISEIGCRAFRIAGKLSGKRYCLHCGSSDAGSAEPLTDIVLWCHMSKELRSGGSDLSQLERIYNVVPGRDCFYTDGHTSNWKLRPEDMALLYQCWDSLLYLSGGEGFGIPAWEAMCSGLPVVFSRYSSHSEFLVQANAGLPVGGLLQPEPSSCILRFIADLAEAIDAVRRLYYNAELRRRLGENGRLFVHDFSVDKQAERWHTAFQNLCDGCQK